jgi:hypothetical protein
MLLSNEARWRWSNYVYKETRPRVCPGPIGLFFLIVQLWTIRQAKASLVVRTALKCYVRLLTPLDARSCCVQLYYVRHGQIRQTDDRRFHRWMTSNDWSTVEFREASKRRPNYHQFRCFPGGFRMGWVEKLMNKNPLRQNNEHDSCRNYLAHKQQFGEFEKVRLQTWERRWEFRITLTSTSKDQAQKCLSRELVCWDSRFQDVLFSYDVFGK